MKTCTICGESFYEQMICKYYAKKHNGATTDTISVCDYCEQEESEILEGNTHDSDHKMIEHNNKKYYYEI